MIENIREDGEIVASNRFVCSSGAAIKIFECQED